MPFGLSTSNAATERVFSALKLIKNDQRNSLHDLTVVSLLRLKFMLKNENTTAAAFVIPEEMIQAVMKVKPNLTIREFMGGIYDDEEEGDGSEDESV